MRRRSKRCADLLPVKGDSNKFFPVTRESYKKCNEASCVENNVEVLQVADRQRKLEIHLCKRQMSGAGNGKELRETLEDPEKDRVEQRH